VRRGFAAVAKRIASVRSRFAEAAKRGAAGEDRVAVAGVEVAADAIELADGEIEVAAGAAELAAGAIDVGVARIELGDAKEKVADAEQEVAAEGIDFAVAAMRLAAVGIEFAALEDSFATHATRARRLVEKARDAGDEIGDAEMTPTRAAHVSRGQVYESLEEGAVFAAKRIALSVKRARRNVNGTCSARAVPVASASYACTFLPERRSRSRHEWVRLRGSDRRRASRSCLME
jgi:hypothetical protein